MSIWNPILQAEEAHQARELIESIAADLVYPRTSPWRWASELEFPESFAYGDAGISVFFCYLAQAFGCARYAELSSLFLESAFTSIGRKSGCRNFPAGSSGVGWAAEHVRRHLPLLPPHDFALRLQTLDEDLSEWCRKSNMSASFADGLAGLCLYGAERIPADSARSLLSIAVNRIEQASEQMQIGVAWPVSAPAQDEIRRVLPSLDFRTSRHSTSLAFGSAGTLGALLACSSSGMPNSRIPDLVNRGISWVLSSRLDSDLPQLFPTVVGVELLGRPGEWYLGDLGVSIVLLGAAARFMRADWHVIAVESARLVAPPKGDRSIDLGLSDGLAGKAHLCNRFYHATGDEYFADLARKYYSQLIRTFCATDLHTPGAAVATRSCQGLFWGTSGVGLSLLAAISSLEPSWDRALFASFRHP